jgi:membrane fusion protein, multidrug efflux system
LRQLEIQEELARKNYERKAALLKNGTTSKEDHDKSKAEWDAAQAMTTKARIELDFMKITAPADGTIIKRDGEIGQLIPAQQPIFWITCCAPLRISVEVNEEDIVQVKPAQEVLIRADAFPDEIFKGTVQSITPKGDPIARTYRVRVGFTEPVPLQIGMTAETNILISKNDNALLVPSTAVLNHKVWLVRDGTLAPKEVTTGAKGVNQIEVRSGVTDGDTLVVAPTSALQAGAKIRTQFKAP